MSNRRIFSASKYDFLKKYASIILEIILKDEDEIRDINLDCEFLLSLLDYLTISKYYDYTSNDETVMFNQQIDFENSIQEIDKNMNFKEIKNPYEEIEKILVILISNLKTLLDYKEGQDNEHMHQVESALKMYEEYNLEKKQSEEVTYGKHHK